MSLVLIAAICAPLSPVSWDDESVETWLVVSAVIWFGVRPDIAVEPMDLIWLVDIAARSEVLMVAIWVAESAPTCVDCN